MIRTWISGGLLCLMMLGLSAQAQQKSPVDAEKEVASYFEATVKSGAKMWNDEKNYEGTYKLYLAALNKAAGMLGQRPDLLKVINARITEAAGQPNVIEKAFILRKAIDETYLTINAGPKSLWDRLGGEPAVRAVVAKFVVKTASNPKVNFFRDGKYKLTDADVARLQQLLVEQISSVSGGPLKYTGRDMKSSHKGMGITEEEFGAMAGDLIAVLKEFKVPQKEIDELVGIIATTKGAIVEGKPEMKKEEPKKDVSLWGRLGGEPAVRAVVAKFVAKTASNPKVNFFRDGKYKLTDADVAKLQQLLVELISSATGGPLKYTGRDMKSSHKGMGITEDEFNAMAGDLIAVLKEFKVPEKEINELVTIVASTKGAIVEGKPEMKEEPKKVEPKKEEPKKETKALWERLGGEKAVRAVVKEFVLTAATNPKVDFLRGGKVEIDEKGLEKLEQLLVEQISSVSGGPLKYTGRSMKESHKGMAITEEQFNALAGDLIATLKKFKVPQKEIDELIAIVATTKDDIVEKK